MSRSYPLASSSGKAKALLWPAFSPERIEAAVRHLAHRPKSVRTLIRWGLENPGPRTIDEARRGAGLSVLTIKSANQVLCAEGMASFKDERSRSGYRRLWTYSGVPLRDFTVDLGSVQKPSSGGSWECASSALLDDGEPPELAHSQDHGDLAFCTVPRSADEPLSWTNGPTSQEDGSGVAHRKESESVQRTQVVQGLTSTPTHLPSFSRARNGEPGSAALWTDESRPEHAALVAYRELIDRRGNTVMPDQLDAIWSDLQELVEDHGSEEGLAFVNHLDRECRAPYRAHVVETFVRDWRNRHGVRRQAANPERIPMAVPEHPRIERNPDGSIKTIRKRGEVRTRPETTEPQPVWLARLDAEFAQEPFVREPAPRKAGEPDVALLRRLSALRAPSGGRLT